MKKFMFVIALAMMVFAVEGYAQRQYDGRGGSSQSSRGFVSRSSVSQQRNSGTVQNGRNSAQRYQRSYGSKPRKIVSSKEDSYRNRNNNARYRGASGHHSEVRHHQGTHHQTGHRHGHQVSGYGHYKPHFSHGSKHYQYQCAFDVWRWVTYLDYHRRFVCNSYYANHYFDTMLGYYVYGSLDAPTRIQIGKLELKRYNSYLGTCNNGYYKSYSVNNPAHITYTVGYKTVDIVIEGGVVRIEIYDEFGNSAVYYM